MKTSSAGTALVAASEGCYLKAYKCPAGIWTIGYGHTSAAGAPEVHPGQTITKDEAVAILANDLTIFERQVEHLVTVHLEPHQFDALVSFTFNVGATNLHKSTLLRELNKGRYEAVPAQLLRWNRAGGKVMPGLTKRRHAEAALWNDVVVPTGHDDGPLPQLVDGIKKDRSSIVTHILPTGAATTLWQHLHMPVVSPEVIHAVGYGLLAGGIFVAGATAHALITRKH